MGRFHPWTPGSALHRIKKSRVLTADISSAAGNNVKMKVKAVNTHNLISQISGCQSIANRLMEHCLDVAVFPPDINITVVGTEDISCDQHAFNNAERILF